MGLAVQRQQKHDQVAKLRPVIRVAHLSFARHRRPRREHRTVASLRCLTRRRAQRLRRVICTHSASKRHDFRESILPTGKMHPLRLRLCGSATGFATQESTCLRRQCAQRSRSVRGTNCLGAAQLTVAPDKTPDPAPGGRAASILPRRTASRRLQTSSAGCTVSRVKRRAALLAAHLAASCG